MIPKSYQFTSEEWFWLALQAGAVAALSLVASATSTQMSDPKFWVGVVGVGALRAIVGKVMDVMNTPTMPSQG